MEPLFSTHYEMKSPPLKLSFREPPSLHDRGEPPYLVSFRWWKEALFGGVLGDETNDVCSIVYSATPQFNDDNDGLEAFGCLGGLKILLSMRGEEVVSVSGGESNYCGKGKLALVSEWMFLSALKWHSDQKGMKISSPRNDRGHQDLFSLGIRLMHVSGTRELVIEIGQNGIDYGPFNKAYNIFTKSGLLQIWDFSRQTNQFFLNDNLSSMDFTKPDGKVSSELYVYGLSGSMNAKESIDMGVVVEQPRTSDPSSSSAVMRNKIENGKFLRDSMSAADSNTDRGTSALGLTGLNNLGNTCYMNSGIQCMAHTPKLEDYFLGNFRKDLNYGNPLGSKGNLATAFGGLLRELWAPDAKPVAPRKFKWILCNFARQYCGNNQHDSQEFLSFLLDGLHEDLNRVKIKPYIEKNEADDRPDEEVADENWKNHLLRNDSVIVDLFHGQYRSSLACPVCKRLSSTFDPFICLSLSIPSPPISKMTLTVMGSDGTLFPFPVTVPVPENGTVRDLIDAVAIACLLREDESLLIMNIHDNSILWPLDNPRETLERTIDNDDTLVAYRLPKAMDDCLLVEFTHQDIIFQPSSSSSSSCESLFGTPLVTRMHDFPMGSEICKEFLKLIRPLFILSEDLLDEFEKNQCDLEFYTEDGDKIEMDEPLCMSQLQEQSDHISLSVRWSEKLFEYYDTSLINQLPPVRDRTGSEGKMSESSIPLKKCIEELLQEEPLGRDDMWYCPNCKKHRQARKKMDIWRLPEILVIHLKRFCFSRSTLAEKVDAFVDFPTDNLDLSEYMIKKEGCPYRYRLYAISNHYGSMGEGHYTAYVKHNLEKWYNFDDLYVNPVTEEQIKTRAAYLLFYKRL